MAEVGQRVTIPSGELGIVIGHVGLDMAIVSLDGETARTITLPENHVRVRPGSPPRSVVVHPSGKASPLSREGRRVRVRKPR